MPPKSKPKDYIGQLVQVTWNDARTDVGWEEDGEHESHAPEVLSVGWVSKTKFKNCIVLHADRGSDPRDKDTNRRIAIPNVWVKDIRRLT